MTRQSQKVISFSAAFIPSNIQFKRVHVHQYIFSQVLCLANVYIEWTHIAVCQIPPRLVNQCLLILSFERWWWWCNLYTCPLYLLCIFVKMSTISFFFYQPKMQYSTSEMYSFDVFFSKPHLQQIGLAS